MKAVTYARVSTSHHEQRPEVQTNELRRYCLARGWEISEELVDHGYSGGTDQRPGLKKLMVLARARKVDAIIVLKLDRLFRSLKHLVTTLDEFHELGITFVAVGDQIDYSSPSGRLLVQVLGSLAEFDKGLLRERTLMGLAHARSIGKTLGRPKKRNDEAIRALKRQGLSYQAIANQLGITKSAVYRGIRAVAKSVKTPQREGREISASCNDRKQPK